MTLPSPAAQRDPARAVLDELRLTRRRRRLADQEWFEIVYRVYLVGIGVIYAVLWSSALIRDQPFNATQLASLRDHGPAVIGALTALVITGALRSGSRGGPLAIEAADVRHLLLAPLDRRMVMLRPAVQRMRSLTLGSAAAGVILGQAAGRRLPTSMYRWAWSAGAVGAALGLGFAAIAMLAHAVGVKQWVATAVGSALLGFEILAVVDVVPAGPLDTVGNLAFWPLRARPVDLVPVVVVAGLAALALAWCGRVSVERLTRRTALVTQLRFAATMQDLRTVMLLRRQLSLEAVRSRPWFRVPEIGGPWWRRSWRSFARFPVRRLGRIAVLAAVGALGVAVAYQGTKLGVILAGLSGFLVGLELIEPLAQHLDHPDLGDLQPHDSGAVHVRLLVASTIVIALVGAVTGALTALVVGGTGHVLLGVLLGAGAALGGGIGAAVSTVSGAPDPVGQRETAAYLPPEVAGMTTIGRMAWPPLLATVASAPVLAARTRGGDSAAEIAVAGRWFLAICVAVAFFGYWFKVRPAFKVWWRRTIDESRDAKVRARR